MDGYKTGLGLQHEFVCTKTERTWTFPFMAVQNGSLSPNVPLWHEINYYQNKLKTNWLETP